MTDLFGPRDPPEARAGELAAAGDWSTLRSELAVLGAEKVLASPFLAYRFGEALYHTGEMRELASFADRYVVVARASSDTLGIMQALNLAGIAAFELGQIDTAEARWDALLGLADGGGDQQMLARAVNNLGAIANLRGHSNQAVVFYRLALPLYQRLGQTRGLAQTHHNVGMSLRDLERYEEAISSFNHAIGLAEGISYTPVVAMTLISRAELELRRADYAAAAEFAARGLAISRELKDPISEGGALRIRGLARGLGGQSAEGRLDLKAALRLARQTGNKLLEAETLRDLGELADESASVGPSLVRALELFQELGASGEAARIRVRLGAD